MSYNQHRNMNPGNYGKFRGPNSQDQLRTAQALYCKTSSMCRFFNSVFATSSVMYCKTYFTGPPSPAVKIFSQSNICWRNVGTDWAHFLSAKLPSGTTPPQPLSQMLANTVGSQLCCLTPSILILTHAYMQFLCV